MSAVVLDAVIVRSVEYRERDRILSLLCAELGRVDVIARGAKSSRTRFGGHIELFNRVEAVVQAGRGSLSTLTGARALDARARLRTDVIAIAFASYATELALLAAAEGQADPEAHAWLERALKAAERFAGSEPAPRWRALAEKVERAYLALHGWLPDLHRCGPCGRVLEGGEARWLDAASLVPHCAACRAAPARTHEITTGPDSVDARRGAWTAAIAAQLGRRPRSAPFFDSLVI